MGAGTAEANGNPPPFQGWRRRRILCSRRNFRRRAILPALPDASPLPPPGFSPEDGTYFREALAFARISLAEREVPVGAVVVSEGRIIGRGRNRREALAAPTHHAEIEALREAGQAAGTWRLSGATLYATLEPCPMCAGALVNARLDRLVYAVADPKAGAVDTLFDVEV